MPLLVMILWIKGRSREGAWIEMHVESCVYYDLPCRSREGAWIEIFDSCAYVARYVVAPVRERGLKSVLYRVSRKETGVAPVRERGLKY